MYPAISQFRGPIPAELLSMSDDKLLRKIEQEFIKESALAPELFKTEIAFHSEVESEANNKTNYPIHKGLTLSLIYGVSKPYLRTISKGFVKDLVLRYSGVFTPDYLFGNGLQPICNCLF